MNATVSHNSQPQGVARIEEGSHAQLHWHVRYDPETSILHAVLTGTVTLDSLQAFTRFCAGFENFRAVLADYSNAELQLSQAEMYALPDAAPQFGIERSLPTAIVVDRSMTREASFAENVFTNRGYSYRVFCETPGAQAWLIAQLSRPQDDMPAGAEGAAPPPVICEDGVPGLSWKLELDSESGILIARIFGELSLDTLDAITSSALEQVSAHAARGILADYRNIRLALSFSQIYDLPLGAKRLGIPFNLPTALVFRRSVFDKASFAENVLNNRGYKYKHFLDMDSAKAWLMRNL